MSEAGHEEWILDGYCRASGELKQGQIEGQDNFIKQLCHILAPARDIVPL